METSSHGRSGARYGSSFGSLVTLLAVAAFGLGACGSSESQDDGDDASSGTPVAAAADIEVPSRVSEAGALNIGAFLGYPPYRYVGEDRKPAGIEIELANAVAQKMGVEAKFQNVEFAALPPAIENGRFDFAVGLNLPLTDENRLDTLGWITSGLVFVVKKGNPEGIDPNNLCSTAVTFGETGGSINLETATAIAADCGEQGKPRPKVREFQDVATRNQALQNGQSTVMLDDPAVAKYTAEEQNVPVEVLPGGELKGEFAEPVPLGWLFRSDDTEMKTAVTQAIDALIEDGTWQSILDRGGVLTPIIPPSFDATAEP